MVFLGLLTLLSPSNFAVVSVSWTWSAVVLSQWVWVQIFRPRKAQGNGKKRQPKMSKIVLHFSTFQGWFIFELFFPFSKFFNMFKFYYKKRQNPKKHHFFRFLRLAQSEKIVAGQKAPLLREIARSGFSAVCSFSPLWFPAVSRQSLSRSNS